MPDDTTIVVFRKWRKKYGEGILALFPKEPAVPGGFLCSSYQHTGQHGAADYALCIHRTVPAAPEEYAELLRELERVGYTNLRILRRYSSR